MSTVAKRQTLEELRQLQRLAGSIIMNPLRSNWTMQKTWLDNRRGKPIERDMHVVTSEFIKPNDRLTSFERIEIYNKQYWFRLVDCMYDDFPGLSAILGRLKFNALIKAYLQEFPSRSYTLRNLGSHMPEFIEKNPRLVAPRKELALDMAKFEWAQVVAFDDPVRPSIGVDDLLGKNPAKLRLALQPYVQLLELRYPLDHYVLALKKHKLRGEASNAMDESQSAKADRKSSRRPPIPRPERIFLAVHRYNNSLYYKRLDADEFQLLTSLSKGRTLQRALADSFGNNPDPARVKTCFETWTSLGWFYRG
ncbi:MAG: DNA-binding domain-containing protein [Tepidisphaeraceae bacterium]|jgi:hypothetical protein